MIILIKMRHGWREVDLADRMSEIADRCEERKNWSGFPHHIWLKSADDFAAAEAFIKTFVGYFTKRPVTFHRFPETAEGVPRLMFCIAWDYRYY